MSTIPVLDKHLESFERPEASLTCGVASMQGWRRTMEDAHAVVMSVPKHPDLSWYAIFDGHGGDLVAILSAQRLLNTICDQPEFADAKTPEEYAACICEGFKAHDAWMQSLALFTSGGDVSGSTATCVLITPTHYVVANLGDSRVVLSRKSEVWATVDHKPDDEEEKQRVIDAGAFVHAGRVCGDLAVSRALGDFTYKMQPNLPPEAQPVSCVPQTTVLKRQAGDEFIILACDGIWDVMDNDGAVQLVLDRILEGEQQPVELAARVVEAAFVRYSRDNLSCSVVLLPDVPKATPEAVAAFQAAKDEAAAQEELAEQLEEMCDLATFNKVAAMKKKLRQFGDRVLTAGDHNGMTVVHHAARGAAIGVLEWIDSIPEVSAGHFSVTDANGRTPACFAAMIGSVPTLQWLINHAEPSAVQLQSPKNGETAMHCAARFGSVECIQLLYDSGCEDHVMARQSGGLTPMHEAARGGHLDALRWLVEHGASCTAKTELGRSVMHEAAAAGNAMVLEWLYLNGGALDLNRRDTKGWTPLDVAATQRHADCLHWALDKNAQSKKPKDPVVAITNMAYDVTMRVDHPTAARWLNQQSQGQRRWTARRGILKLRALRALADETQGKAGGMPRALPSPAMDAASWPQVVELATPAAGQTAQAGAEEVKTELELVADPGTPPFTPVPPTRAPLAQQGGLVGASEALELEGDSKAGIMLASPVVGSSSNDGNRAQQQPCDDDPDSPVPNPGYIDGSASRNSGNWPSAPAAVISAGAASAAAPAALPSFVMQQSDVEPAVVPIKAKSGCCSIM